METTGNVGVTRLAGGSRRLLWPEVTAQACPVCGGATYLTRTMQDTPPRWYRFDDRGLDAEHQCAGMSGRLAALNLPPVRIIASDEVDTQASAVEKTGSPSRHPADGLRRRSTAGSKTTTRPGRESLQALINASRPGDRIRVPAGVHPEQLVLRHSLTLIAEDGEAVIAPTIGPAIVLYGCGAELEGLTLWPEGGDGIDLMPAIAGATTARPVLGLTHCTVRAPGRAIVVARPNASVRLAHTAIESAIGAGLVLDDDAALRAVDSTIETGGGRGITAGDRAILQLEGTRVERCGGDGIRTGRDSVLWGNFDDPVWVRNNRGHGIAAGPGSTMTLVGSIIAGNSGWGIQVPGGTVTIVRVINADNGRGTLDPRGTPTLVGTWNSAYPEPIPAIPDEPELNDTDDPANLPEPIPYGADAVEGRDPEPDSDVVEQPMMPDVDTPHESSSHVAEALLRLAALPGMDQARLHDPRFRWLIHSLPPAFHRVPLLVEAMARATDFPIVPEATLNLLDRLVEYAEWLVTVPLDEELQGIIAPMVAPQWAEPIASRLGWSGLEPLTLQQAADQAGVSRERVRQVQTRVQQRLGEGYIWAPALDRCVQVLLDLVPVRCDVAARRLASDDLNEGRPFDVASLVAAAETVGRGGALELIERHGVEFLVAHGEGDSTELDRFGQVRSTIRKLISNQGMAVTSEVVAALGEQGIDASSAEIANIARELDDVRVTAGVYLVPTRWESRNPLWNRLAKLLCVAPGLDIAVAAHQLVRDERRGYPVTARALARFAEAHPDLRVSADGRLTSVVPIDPEQALSQTERLLVDSFRKHGPELSFTGLSPLMEAAGFTRITLAVRLGQSPLIVRLAHNRYRLISATDTLADLDEGLEAVTKGPGPAANEANDFPEPGLDTVVIGRTAPDDTSLANPTGLEDDVVDTVLSVVPEATSSEDAGDHDGSGSDRQTIAIAGEDSVESRLDRLVCAVPRVKVGMALWQLARDPDLGYPRDQRAVHATAMSHPVLGLAANRPVWSARHLDPEVDLDAGDRALLAAFRANGPVLTIAELADLTDIAGGSDGIARRLHTTPFVLALRDGRYRLVTRDDLPSQPDVLRPDNETVLADAGPIDAIASTIPGDTANVSNDRGVEVNESPGDDDPDESPLPRLVVAPEVGRRVDLPDPVTVPLHRLIDDLFAGRLQWPEETRRQRWSPTRLPDLLDGIYAGLPISPIVVRRREGGDPAAGGRRAMPVDEIVDGQQRLGLLARLFNPHYRVPGQPPTGPVFVGFRPETARFVLAETATSDDPFVVTGVGALLRGETTAWRVTAAWLDAIRTVRTVNDETAERVAAAIAGIATVRDAPITVQRVATSLEPDEIAGLYDRLHRG
ncbi:MAG TPA: right-handed parallel beta-helix repeat-containing protein [Thermomicrobiales bacterium]|jgi:hypothetical protein|nr:right-handed parallel beta-helix repeat-containing protein [Thermomicrobiales bacterium]